jgi:hypothetical protein
MTPRVLPMLPALLSMTLLGVLLAATGAGAHDLRAAASNDNNHAAAAPGTRSPDGRTPVTRSDGSTGFTRPPDPKDIHKLVGYMRDGMARADRSEQQKQTRKAIQYKRDKRSRR